MRDRHILCGSKPCGCMGVVFHVIPGADQTGIAEAELAIERLGYKPEWLTPEEREARPWDCPEHAAIRNRLARLKVGI